MVDPMKPLVLFSGGSDSALCLLRALDVVGFHDWVFVAFLDYGQPAVEQEATAAVRFLRMLYYPPPLLIGRTYVPGVSFLGSGDGSRVVPGRNLALYRAVLPSAHALGCDRVWYGAIADDAADYEDCRPSWAASVSDPGIPLEAPLASLTKRDVVRELRKRGVDPRSLWSCYSPSPGGRPCGVCRSCVALEAAMSLEESRC